jgi:hypothetical protein
MIGEPPQSSKIDFDTGSSQFIISDCAEFSGSTHCDSAASTTFHVNGKPWHIAYGKMSQAQSILSHDLVRINDLEVQNQQLALITNESHGFDDEIDRIMGLAFRSLSNSIASSKTVFENMMAQSLLDQGIFSFYLRKTSLAGSGDVIFDGMSSSRIKSGHTLTYTPVTCPKYQ